MSKLDSIIETQEFATLPPVAAKILNLLQEENVEVRDIVKLIETDASLTLKLLRVANSPLYATRTEINSIHQAIITLGLNRLTNIVLGVSIFSRFLFSTNKQIADVMNKFWWHASCTGIIAKAFAQKLNKQYKELEFIGGLLHDIGKLALLQFDSNKYLEVIELTNNQYIRDIDAETQIFGVNHLEVGEQIAKLWKLPNELVSIIGYHSQLGKLDHNQDLVSIVRFADLLCEIWDAHMYEGIQLIQFAEEDSWRILCKIVPQLENMDVEIFTFELENEFRKSTDFLNAISK